MPTAKGPVLNISTNDDLIAIIFLLIPLNLIYCSSAMDLWSYITKTKTIKLSRIRSNSIVEVILLFNIHRFLGQLNDNINT